MLQISPINEYLYSVKFDENDARQLKQELCTDKNWIQENPIWRNDENLKRFHIQVSTNPVIKKYLDYFSSEACKNQLLDLAFNNKSFMSLWGVPDRSKLSSLLVPYIKFVKDEPGYYTDLHCDAKTQIIFGMIYLTEENDRNQTTIFYYDRYKNYPTYAETGMGLGWLLINHNNSYHEGGNKSNQDRYCIQFGLIFNFTT